MEFAQLTPNIMVDEMAETLDFYCEILNFQMVQQHPPGDQPEWAMLQNGQTSLMFQTRKSLSEELPHFKEKALGGGLTFFVKLKGITELYEKVQRHWPIHKQLNQTFYGSTEFSVMDPNGFTLTFAEFPEEFKTE